MWISSLLVMLRALWPVCRWTWLHDHRVELKPSLCGHYYGFGGSILPVPMLIVDRADKAELWRVRGEPYIQLPNDDPTVSRIRALAYASRSRGLPRNRIHITFNKSFLLCYTPEVL